VAIVIGSYLILRLARSWFYRRIGGVNGDCLGFTEQLMEVFVLVLFTCYACTW
jgi:cobalamin synthase